MAGIPDKGLLTLGGFPAGVNNLAREVELPRDNHGAQIALREAENADLSSAGKARLREGYELVQACTRAHSGWSDDYLNFGLMVDAGTMYAVWEDGSREALLTGLAAGLPVSYCLINDGVFWSNSVQSGVVTLGLELLTWACPHPNGQPTLAASADGALDAGLYQVAVTFFDARGRESGASRAAPITLESPGAIELTNIPQPPAGGRVRIYVTSGKDRVLRAAVTLDAGITEYRLAQAAQGRPCETLLLRPMPPGQLVAHGDGRQFVARNHEVLFSPALRYGLFDPKKGRVGFVGRVDMLAFVGDGTDGAGLFVSDGKRTYFLAGADPMQWRRPIVSGYGAVPGQLAMVPGDVWGLDSKQLLPVWQSRNGRLCVGLPGGGIFHPQPREAGPDAVFDQADRAALMFREHDGERRIVSSLKGARPQALAITDKLIVREYRHDE